ncbi:hypothetical protein AHF37_03870 [Paragonimus kellicotti]|nr:hypothetical protein AHF37_03870 [Paragonimus kellicotti]
MKPNKDLDVRFTNLDLNGDGKISREEYQVELKRLNLPASMLDLWVHNEETLRFITLSQRARAFAMRSHVSKMRSKSSTSELRLVHRKLPSNSKVDLRLTGAQK